MDSEPTELIEFLAPYSQEIRELTLECRRALLALLGPITELLYDATSAVCVGFTHTGEPRDNFVNLAVYAKHVTLVFAWGVNLVDPERRLKGEGSQVRHIRLSGIETLHDAYVVGLIEQASARAPRRASPIEPRRYVKVHRGPKRRRSQ